MTPLNGIGEALRLLREAVRPKMTKVALANAIGVRQSNITRLESEKSNPNAQTLDRLLVALGKDAHDLADALDRVNGRQRDELGEVYADDDAIDTMERKMAARFERFATLLERRLERKFRLVKPLPPDEETESPAKPENEPPGKGES